MIDSITSQNIVLIGDRRVKSVLVKECGEPIVDLLKDYPELKLDLERDRVQKQSQSISLARKKLARC